MLKFKHASESQAKYMIRLAFVSALYLSLRQQYKDAEGREKIKEIVNRDYEYTQSLFRNAKGQFDRYELAQIQKKIDIIFSKGYDEVDSAQTYIASMIGLVSEMLTEIPETSKKFKPLEELLKRLESLYSYFASRTRQDRFDKQGLELMEEINQQFVVG